jgi:hypothetical protein
VPRGGLPRLKQFNDLESGGSIDLPIGSLCISAQVTHRRRAPALQERATARGWCQGGPRDRDQEEFAG